MEDNIEGVALLVSENQVVAMDPNAPENTDEFAIEPEGFMA